jgi:4-aminobutyrate aminotransferase-like enzyme
MGCAAALATIEVIRRECLTKNALDRGAQLRLGLAGLLRHHNTIGHGPFSITGLGLMVGLVCPSVEVAAALRDACQHYGLLLMTAGGGQVLRFMPPLVVSTGEMDEALSAVERAFGQVLYARGRNR